MNLEKLKVYTVDEVAYALRVTPVTVYRMIKKGEIGAIRLGTTIRIPEAAIAKILKTSIEEQIDKEIEDALREEGSGDWQVSDGETESVW